MSSYSNRFGAATITTSEISYLAFSLNANSVLSWPIQFIDIPYGSTTQATAARIMDITPGGGGLTLRLPDATLVSPGQDMLITNTNATAFNLILNDGVTVLTTITANSAVYLYLTNNTTTNGVWRVTPWAGGVVAVTSVGMAVGNNNLTVVSSTTNPIVGNGVFTVSLANDLLALTGFGGSTGYAARTAANTWALRTFSGTAGQIAITNPGGVAGPSTFALATNITGIQSITLAGGLAINGTTLSNTAAGDLTIATSNSALYYADFTSGIKISGNAGPVTTNQLRFYNAANTFYSSFQAAADQAANLVYIWPSAAPALDQVPRVSSLGPPIELEWSTIPTFPGVSTVNAIARYANTTGSLNNSGVLIDNANAITGATSLTSGNIIIAANTISTSIGTLSLDPNGSSQVIITGISYPLSTDTGNIESCVPTADGLNEFIFSANVNENLLMNGAMDVWQRNTTFTNATYFPNNSGIYTADGYWFESGINAAPVDDVVNISQFARAFNTAACAFNNVMRFTITNTGTGNKFATFQFLENYKTAKIAGQVASFSFVCAGSTATNIRAALVSWTGAADTLTKPVITAFNAAGTNPTLAASYDYLGSEPINTAITANLARLKFENIAVPSNCTNLAVMIWYDDATAANTTTLDISAVKVEQGPSCTAFKPLDLDLEIIQCQRWFRKSWPITTAVGTAATINAKAIVSAAVSPIGNTLTYGTHRFDYPMRATPGTLNLYAEDGATANVATELAVGGTAGANQAANSAIVLLKDTTGFTIKNNSGGNITSASTAYIVHYYADASL